LDLRLKRVGKNEGECTERAEIRIAESLAIEEACKMIF